MRVPTIRLRLSHSYTTHGSFHRWLLALVLLATSGSLCSQIPSGHLIISDSPSSIEVVDPISLRSTRLPTLRDSANRPIISLGSVPSGHPDSVVFSAISQPNESSGLGIARLDGSRISQFTYLSQLLLPNEATVFTPVQSWRGGMVFCAFSVALTIPGGVYAIQPWPSGPATLISQGPRVGRPWVNVSVHGDHAVMFDLDRMYVLDLNTRQVAAGLSIAQLGVGLGSMQAFQAVAPGVAVVVTNTGKVIGMNLTQGSVIGWIPGYHQSNDVYSVAVHPQLGILVSHRWVVYRLGAPSVRLWGSQGGNVRLMSVVEHSQPSFFTFAHGSTTNEPYHDAIGLPSLGNSSFALTIARAAANSPAVLFLGTTRTHAEMTPLGLPDCWLLTIPLVSVHMPTDGAGTATLRMPIPNDPTFAGQRCIAQWGVASGGSLRLSEGALIVPR